jgi:hypothetical protein
MTYSPEAGRVGTIHSSHANLDRSHVAVFGCGVTHIKQLRRPRALVYLLASAIVAFTSADAFPTPGHKQVSSHRGKAAKAVHHKHGSAIEAKRSERAPGPRILPPNIPPNTDNLAPAVGSCRAKTGDRASAAAQVQ